MKTSSEERFWRLVDRTEECWLWTGTKNLKGYGKIKIDGRPVLVHRFSYELVNGQIGAGLLIDHTCHTPACVNPAHLRAVTTKQNNENLSGATSLSKTGIRGVSPFQGKFRVTVGHNGGQHYGGTFSTIHEAEAAAIALRNSLHTHNHIDRKAS